MAASSCDLRLGLRLEDEDVLLPWNATFRDLRALASPLRDGRALIWRRRTCLGGLKANVVAWLSKGRAVRFTLGPVRPRGVTEEESSRKMAAHFRRLWGKPTRSWPGWWPPAAEWERAGVLVRLCMDEPLIWQHATWVEIESRRYSAP
ncbi:MAG: hypothetical protein HYY17_07230 [Planctomycetes bacterium]|nr:hypothetical protein [Planctomycetota bacterium]